ncbi:MAG: hypothetical protein JWR26_2656 [Pedosphaera sp.]|nr:hypothetical protein [Pedosphaera sp.]
MAGDPEAIQITRIPDLAGKAFLRCQAGSQRWIMREKFPRQFLPHFILPELKDLKARAWSRDDEKHRRPGSQASQNGLKCARKLVFRWSVDIQPELYQTKVLAGLKIKNREVRVSRKWLVKLAASQHPSHASV